MVVTNDGIINHKYNEDVEMFFSTVCCKDVKKPSLINAQYIDKNSKLVEKL